MRAYVARTKRGGGSSPKELKKQSQKDAHELVEALARNAMASFPLPLSALSFPLSSSRCASELARRLCRRSE